MPQRIFLQDIFVDKLQDGTTATIRRAELLDGTPAAPPAGPGGSGILRIHLFSRRGGDGMGWFGKKKAGGVPDGAGGSGGPSAEAVLAVLSTVDDPEIGRDLVSLGMIRNVEVRGGDVSLDLVLTTPACPMKKQIRDSVEAAVRTLPGVAAVDVRVGAEVRQGQGAPAGPDSMRKAIPGVRNVIAVASGKGGVGKSTVSANLAAALALDGARVGLLDADIYGPSAPTLFGLKGHRLEAKEGWIVPAEAHGVKVLSIGFAVAEDDPIIWRGPMLMKALTQFLHETAWGELDYLVVDLPPGTGDVQISLVQMVPVAGAVVVSTPQDLALVDAKKAVRMFEKVGVPILGVVENMSTFLCPHCGGRSDIFGHGGAKAACDSMKLPFLGEVPLQVELREASDSGTPLVASKPEAEAAKALVAVARGAASALARLEI
jgi:ATP-binding protein involved in chromosome partitioning